MAVFQRILSSDKIRDRKTGRLIKSSAERYKNVETGKIVSRRQRDKQVKAIPKIIRVSMTRQNDALVQSYMDKLAQKGKTITKRKANLSPAYTGIVRDLRRGAKLRRSAKPEDRFKGNELIREALEKTTRRDKVALDIVPGESG